MTSLATVVTNLGNVQAHVRPVASEIADRFGPLYFIWGAPGRGTGDHAKGLALDFMTYELGAGVKNPGPIRHSLGEDIARYVLINRVRLNVEYIIYDKRIVSAKSDWKWRLYDGDNPHVDHVHVSFKETGTYKAPPVPAPPKDDMADIDYDRLADAVWERVLKHPDYEGHDTNASGWLTSMAIRTNKATVALAKAIQALADGVPAPTVRSAVYDALKDVK